MQCILYSLFSFNDTVTPAIYSLSLHDALPISRFSFRTLRGCRIRKEDPPSPGRGRKSTRLNSSPVAISYAVFCLKIKIQSTNNSDGDSVLLFEHLPTY